MVPRSASQSISPCLRPIRDRRIPGPNISYCAASARPETPGGAGGAANPSNNAERNVSSGKMFSRREDSHRAKADNRGRPRFLPRDVPFILRRDPPAPRRGGAREGDDEKKGNEGWIELRRIKVGAHKRQQVEALQGSAPGLDVWLDQGESLHEPRGVERLKAVPKAAPIETGRDLAFRSGIFAGLVGTIWFVRSSSAA